MISITVSGWWSEPHSASCFIFPVRSLIGIFFVMISCVEFSFWIANGIVIDCMPSKRKKIVYDGSQEIVKYSYRHQLKPEVVLIVSNFCDRKNVFKFEIFVSKHKTYWIKFCGKLDKLSSNNFWLSSIFSLIFWFCVWMAKCCLLSLSKFLCEVTNSGGCCGWFWFGIRKFSSFDDSSQHDSSEHDVMSSWNESW